MKKHVFGKKFNRDTNERKALFKSLISALVLKERIQTTEAKAKAIKSSTEKSVTRAKKSGNLARRFLGDMVNSAAMDKLINDIAPRFKNRNGGYTRIIRVGRRFGDNAMEVIMEWTEAPVASARPQAAHSTKTKASKATRPLSERRPRRGSRPSVAPRSSKSPSQKTKRGKSK